MAVIEINRSQHVLQTSAYLVIWPRALRIGNRESAVLCIVVRGVRSAVEGRIIRRAWKEKIGVINELTKVKIAPAQLVLLSLIFAEINASEVFLRRLRLNKCRFLFYFLTLFAFCPTFITYRFAVGLKQILLQVFPWIRPNGFVFEILLNFYIRECCRLNHDRIQIVALPKIQDILMPSS